MALYLSTVPCARAFRLVRASHEFKSLPIVLQAEMTERATCWSLTINNPTEQDLKVSLPAGWSMTGQMERGEEGTEHYQGMLKTTQVRFTAVKKLFPRAHIEVARNRAALAKYVHKDETRLATVADNKSPQVSLFDYQHTIAGRWDDNVFYQRVQQRRDYEDEHKGEKYQEEDDLALAYLDDMVAQDIENGVIGVEYIAINPMWRSAWKKFWRQMVARERKLSADADRQTDEAEE